MTNPGGQQPDDTFGADLSALDDLQRTQWEGRQREKLTGWDDAHDVFAGRRDRYSTSLAQMHDGQLAMAETTDLLTNVSAYGCAVMGRNWQFPQQQTRVMPFDRQVGQSKLVEVVSEDIYHGRLRLKAGGLWRVDTMMSMEYKAYITDWYNLTIGFYEKTVTPVYAIEVVDAAGNVFTAREFQGTSALTKWVNANTQPPVRYQSCAFSHTFVIPPMPPPDAPGAAAAWMYVRLTAQWRSVANTLVSGSYAKFIGGTEKSALYATRWSLDTDHLDSQPTVPDGGTLG